jgi:hypothetical protein
LFDFNHIAEHAGRALGWRPAQAIWAGTTQIKSREASPSGLASGTKTCTSSTNRAMEIERHCWSNKCSSHVFPLSFFGDDHLFFFWTSGISARSRSADHSNNFSRRF